MSDEDTECWSPFIMINQTCHRQGLMGIWKPIHLYIYLPCHTKAKLVLMNGEMDYLQTTQDKSSQKTSYIILHGWLTLDS